LVKSHTAYEHMTQKYEHMTQKYEQILLIKPKTFKSLSERSRLFGGQSKTHQYMWVHQVPTIQATWEHALSYNITAPSVSMLGSFLLMAVALRSQKVFTTPLHVAGDVRATEC